MIVKLPRWVLVEKFPAFNDLESLTVNEQTARIYGKMNELIESYNKYVDEVNKTLEEFEVEKDKPIQEFICRISCLTDNYINTVDMKIAHQDRQIAEVYSKFNEDVINTLKLIISDLKSTGELDNAIYEAIDGIDGKVDNFISECEEFKKECEKFKTDMNSEYEEFTEYIESNYQSLNINLQEQYQITKTNLESDYQTTKTNLESDYQTTKTNLESDYNVFKGQLQETANTVTNGDYVIEQGIINNWTYRKWNSGIYECWVLMTDNSFKGNNRESNGLHLGYNTIDLPIQLISPPVVNVTVSATIGFDFIGKVNTTPNSFTYYVGSTSDQTTVCEVYAYVIGKWK